MQSQNACIESFYIHFKNKIDSAHVICKFENNSIIHTYTAYISFKCFYLKKINKKNKYI